MQALLICPHFQKGGEKKSYKIITLPLGSGSLKVTSVGVLVGSCESTKSRERMLLCLARFGI